jgi:hypothetical protein
MEQSPALSPEMGRQRRQVRRVIYDENT